MSRAVRLTYGVILAGWRTAYPILWVRLARFASRDLRDMETFVLEGRGALRHAAGRGRGPDDRRAADYT
ncbi:hypothetical protein HOK021_10100 [Streptomyces hygroscopicus]|nr:hypothetical protein HOK021_10100 [Streptomyces hygroscopicus]